MSDLGADCSSNPGEDLQGWEELPDVEVSSSEWFLVVIPEDDE